jgi:hypothetical protein
MCHERLPVKTLLLIVAALLLAACGTLGPTEGQMKAMEGSSMSMCFESPGWNGAAVKVHITSFGGKATGTGGGGGEATCGSSTVKFNNEGKAPAVTK